MQDTNKRFTAPGLQKAMREQGRTLRWLAAKVGVDAPHLTHTCRGRRTISYDTAWLISTILGVDFGLLFESPDGDTSTPERAA